MSLPDAYRLCDARFNRADAFSGEGARLEGGRWNSPGRAVVYAASSFGAVASEILVHLYAPYPTTVKWHYFEIDFNGLAPIVPDQLPRGWDQTPPSSPSAQVGDTWLDAGNAAVFAVPSALFPRETTFLINPAHADFKQITITGPFPYIFPPRLFTR